MVRARWSGWVAVLWLAIGALVIGMLPVTVGCGGGVAKHDPIVILGFYQNDKEAAAKIYEGKTIRLEIEKVTAAHKSGKALEFVTVQGKVDQGQIMIDVTVSDPPEQEKALALKVGEPATFEGQVAGTMGETRGYGVVFFKATKVVGK